MLLVHCPVAVVLFIAEPSCSSVGLEGAIRCSERPIGSRTCAIVTFGCASIFGLVSVTKKVPLVLALALAGGALELIQALPIIGREAALLDWCANMLGISVGLTLFGPAGRVMDTRLASISARVAS